MKNQVLQWLRRVLKRQPPAPPVTPEDPYAYVGAPKKPRPPLRGAAAAVDPED
jgi:hypothetical protein